jgi:hypothetical protein
LHHYPERPALTAISYDSDGLLTNSSSLALHRFFPLEDPRWNEYLQEHPHASVFHTTEWLGALRHTYRYQPIGYSSSQPGNALQNVLVFCLVDSWITGRRLVSLPFSDHCAPLLQSPADLAAFVPPLDEILRLESLRYIELRTVQQNSDTIHEPSFGLSSQLSHSYCLHKIDLGPSLDELFKNCQQDSIQRKILRAQREGLSYEEGRSGDFIKSFYHLLLATRRRHGLPPQPLAWFQSLIDHFGEALKIRIAFYNRQPIASILTLRFKDTLVYKYGCSDARFHSLGGMHLLFWRSIQEAKIDRLSLFDLGRSNWEDDGLITFKDRWGAQRSQLNYIRISPAKSKSRTGELPAWRRQFVKRVFRMLPDRFLRTSGELLYRHLG